MNTKQFIEDAIEGGWDSAVTEEHLAEIEDIGFVTIHTAGWMFLVPAVWQAVGKTRGWDMIEGHRCIETKDGHLEMFGTEALLNSLQFICHLADGLSIEEALGKI
jgi:hypothetical protein